MSGELWSSGGVQERRFNPQTKQQMNTTITLIHTFTKRERTGNKIKHVTPWGNETIENERVDVTRTITATLDCNAELETIFGKLAAKAIRSKGGKSVGMNGLIVVKVKASHLDSIISSEPEKLSNNAAYVKS